MHTAGLGVAHERITQKNICWLHVESFHSIDDLILQIFQNVLFFRGRKSKVNFIEINKQENEKSFLQMFI